MTDVQASPLETAVAYVEHMNWVSYVGLMGRMSGLMTVKGELGTTIDEWNLVLWQGMSEEFCDLVHELKQDPRIVVKTGSVLSYMIDGGFLTLPVAKRANHRYVKPHWLPTFFCRAGTK